MGLKCKCYSPNKTHMSQSFKTLYGREKRNILLKRKKRSLIEVFYDLCNAAHISENEKNNHTNIEDKTVEKTS